MGLDLALGGIILIAAIRGWLHGFVSQAVRIVGFVACFYLADPVRDQSRPYVLAKLPKIDPAVMDRILWWVAAVVSYVLLVGLTTLAIKIMRPPVEPGMPRPTRNRNDQFAGFLLGAAKGAVFVMFLVAGIQKYALDQIKATPWAEQQVSQSLALKWNEEYQPVPKIWSSVPVKHFVNHIQRNGFKGEAETNPSNQVAERAQNDSTSKPPRLEVSSDNAAAGVDDELSRAVDEIKAQLKARGDGRD